MTSPGSIDPALARRRLRRELTNAREAAKLKQAEVAKAMDWSLSKLLRIESGQVSISTNDLRVLLNHYDVDPARRSALVEMGRAARDRSWWYDYKQKISEEYEQCLGFESSATVIRNYEPIVVPGLLQTREYATETIKLSADLSSAERESQVDLRMERQERLTDRADVSLHFILDESAIRRRVHNQMVTKRQLERLHELAVRPHISISIVPFSAGLYSAMRFSYVIYEFPDPDDGDVLWVENPLTELDKGVIVREDTHLPARFLQYFYQLEQAAHRDDMFSADIRSAIKQLPD